jgi:hypothetical protein
LTEKWNPTPHEVPTARSLTSDEEENETYLDYPFPLSLDSQKRLLQLIHNRKSGIISRQEIKDVLYPSETLQ